MGNTWTTRQKRDRKKELKENRSVKVEVQRQTEEDRERVRRESEAFFKAWGEGMRGGAAVSTKALKQALMDLHEHVWSCTDKKRADEVLFPALAELKTLESARNAALEEAASLVDDQGHNADVTASGMESSVMRTKWLGVRDAMQDVAAAIRAMKGGGK